MSEAKIQLKQQIKNCTNLGNANAEIIGSSGNGNEKCQGHVVRNSVKDLAAQEMLSQGYLPLLGLEEPHLIEETWDF